MIHNCIAACPCEGKGLESVRFPTRDARLRTSAHVETLLNKLWLRRMMTHGWQVSLADKATSPKTLSLKSPQP